MVSYTCTYHGTITGTMVWYMCTCVRARLRWYGRVCYHGTMVGYHGMVTISYHGIIPHHSIPYHGSIPYHTIPYHGTIWYHTVTIHSIPWYHVSYHGNHTFHSMVSLVTVVWYHGMVWYQMLFEVPWDGMVPWYGMAWDGTRVRTMVWCHGMVWYGRMYGTSTMVWPYGTMVWYHGVAWYGIRVLPWYGMVSMVQVY
jgi:hypothetical protein